MTQKSQSFWVTPKGLTALGLIAFTSYFLLVEHREHIFPILPYLILLACPFMHFFMHGGHGHGLSHHESKSEHDAYQRELEEGRKQNQSRHH
jgi:hypothetical protein